MFGGRLGKFDYDMGDDQVRLLGFLYKKKTIFYMDSRIDIFHRRKNFFEHALKAQNTCCSRTKSKSIKFVMRGEHR